jgi:hypothetical protein
MTKTSPLRRIISSRSLAKYCVIFLTLAFIPTLVGQATCRSNPHPPQYSGPAFRYVIVYNDPALNGVGRDLTVLMDPAEFDEASLRALFELLKQRFHNLPGFTAYIQTSLQDVQTPEERDGPAFSETPSNPKAFLTPSATIKHSAKADILYMFVPSRKTEHPVKIDLRVPIN